MRAALHCTETARLNYYKTKYTLKNSCEKKSADKFSVLLELYGMLNLHIYLKISIMELFCLPIFFMRGGRGLVIDIHTSLEL